MAPGLPAKLYTADQLRRLDALAIEKYGIPGLELMQRAGLATFQATRQFVPEAERWLVFCGAGNNAGDGYVIASLAAKAGLQVRVVALKSPEQLSGDAMAAAEQWAAGGGQVVDWADFDRESGAEVIIDALLGTGLDRPLSAAFAEAVAWINNADAQRIAVDIPTGLHADTGCILGAAVRAQLTVTFIGLKRGLFTADGPDCAGKLGFADLDLPPAAYQMVGNSGELIGEFRVADWLEARPRNVHKAHFGHVLVVGGEHGMGGAARLAGEAALRSGAGLVSIATRGEHAQALNASRPELMVHGCEDADSLVPLLARATVVAIGPGLGKGRWSGALLESALQSGHSMVLDADALSLLAQTGASLEPEHCVLTPHPGEAACLLGCTTNEVQADRAGHAHAIARRYGAVTVLKGCGTVVAHPDGRYAIVALGNPGMATAGSGDVLTGVIAACLAQRLDPWQAARAGVALHAAAGDDAADRLGQRSLLAGDITDALHRVLR